MLQEFKKFATCSNVVDLALGVVIGVAFGKVVDSLVDVIMRIAGRVVDGLNFNNNFLRLPP